MRMFEGVSSFNQPLNDWSVDQVMDMNSMFSGALSFNQPLNAWAVDQVVDMAYPHVQWSYLVRPALEQLASWLPVDMRAAATLPRQPRARF